jgi:hypothetical protein
MVVVSSAPRIDARLRDYRPPAGRWLSWQRDQPSLDGLDYAEVRRLLLERGWPHEQKDALLLALIHHATTDTEAAVCVTACLYPGLSRIAHRYYDILDHDDVWAALAEALIRRLRTCNPDRPHRFVAANLLREAARDLRRLVRLERLWRDHVRLDEQPVVERTSPAEVPIERDSLADRGQFTALDVALIRATRIGGLTLHEASALLGLSYEAAKKRRQRAEAVWLNRAGQSTPVGRRRGSPPELAA